MCDKQTDKNRTHLADLVVLLAALVVSNVLISLCLHWLALLVTTGIAALDAVHVIFANATQRSAALLNLQRVGNSVETEISLGARARGSRPATTSEDRKSSMHSEYVNILCDTHHFVAAADTYIAVCKFRDSVNLTLHARRLRAGLLGFQRARAYNMCLKAV
jgi:hypothetical protein